MAAVTICSDFRAQKNKVSHCFPLCHEVMGPDAMILVFWTVSFKPAFSLSSFTFIKGLFSSSLSVVRVVSSAYLRLLIFSPAILIPACASSSSVFLLIYSAYKLNKQGDNIQPWHTPFPIWNQSVVLCPVLTFASWPAYRFLKRQVRWSGGSDGKQSACNVGDLGSILGLGGSPGEWNGYPLQYLGLENSINECCPWITHKYSSPSFQFPPFYLEPSIYLVSPPKLDGEVGSCFSILWPLNKVCAVLISASVSATRCMNPIRERTSLIQIRGRGLG